MSEGIKFNCWREQNYTDTEKGVCMHTYVHSHPPIMIYLSYTSIILNDPR